MKNRKILGSGYAIPKHCITNKDLENVVDTNDQWIVQRTGISTRYVSCEENTSELGYRAALQAIENTQIDKEEIDLIIVCTMTPDHYTPSCACLIQEKLGLNHKNVMAFDLNAACSGFLYGLQTAYFLLEQYKTALIIGSETISKLIDWKDRNTCVLFGDGAGAFIIRNEKHEGTSSHFATSIGDANGVLRAKGRQLCPNPLDNSIENNEYLKMDGTEVFRFAINAMEDGIKKVLEKANKSLDEIDYIIPHQANVRIINHVAKKLKLSEDKFYMNVDKFGNTVAASIPLAYAMAQQEGKLKPGMKIILVGFGAGFTYAASYIEI